MDIADKRVLITGGSSGIGLATAQELLARGARVVISGRRPEVLAAAADQLRDLGEVHTIAADVTAEEGRAATLLTALEKLGGLDILVNNAGGVRAGRLEDTTEAEIRAMIEVDLVAPILLTRAALPSLRASGDALIVDVSSSIALVGMPFYATYAAVKAGLARFDEALRRELKGEGIHVLTVYPAGTDTPMMATNRGTPELGFGKEPASAVAQAIIGGIESAAFEVIRADEARAQTIALNRENPLTIDQHLLGAKEALAEAVRDHSAL